MTGELVTITCDQQTGNKEGNRTPAVEDVRARMRVRRLDVFECEPKAAKDKLFD